MDYRIEYDSIEKYLRRNEILFGPIYTRLEELEISSLFVKPLLEKFCITDAKSLARTLLNPKNEVPLKLFLKESYPKYLIYLSGEQTEIFCSDLGISDQKLFQGDILTLKIATNYVLKEYANSLAQNQVSR